MVKLGDAVREDGGVLQTGPFGSQLKQSEYSSEGVPVIMPKDIQNGEVLAESVARVPEATADRLTRHRVATNAIVLPRRGEVTKRAFIGELQAGWLCGTGCLKIEAKGNRIWPKFLYYYLGTPRSIDWLERNAVGSTMLNLSAKIVSRFPVCLPPVQVQKEISSILSAYDDLIANHQRQIAMLQEAARMLYGEWFVHFRFPGHKHAKVSGGLPEGWVRRSICELADIFRGKSYKSSELVKADDQPFVNLKCIDRFGGFRVSGLKRFKGEHKEHHCVRAGQIVIAVTDMTREAMIVAQAARVPKTIGENAIYSMDLVKAVPKEGIEPEWFYGMLRFSPFSAEVREAATGATVLHLKPKYIESWPVIVPPPVLRAQFADQFDGILQQIDNLELQNEKLGQARDLLLPRLINATIAA